MQYHDNVIVLETNLDDCTGEALGYTMELLEQQGALDVSYTPIYMKKNRPAYALKVICKPEQEEALIHTIFRETGAIGLRRTPTERIIMDREPTTVMTPYGSVAAKKCMYHDIQKTTIEYESAKQLAETNQVPLTEILHFFQNKGNQK